MSYTTAKAAVAAAQQKLATAPNAKKAEAQLALSAAEAHLATFEFESKLSDLGVEPTLGLAPWQSEFSGQKVSELLTPSGKKPRFQMENGDFVPASFIMGAADKAGLAIAEALFDRKSKGTFSEVVAS